MTSQPDQAEFLPDFLEAVFQIIPAFMDQHHVVHDPDIILNFQFFFYEVVDPIQKADACDLHHLAAGIINNF